MLKYVHLEQTDSTNAFLQRKQSETDIRNWVVSADEQTAGKGMGSNTWESEAGKNLTFSFALDMGFLPAERQFLLSVAVPLGIVEVLDTMLPAEKLNIKWPNDIYYEDRKIAGILIENAIIGSELKYAVAGIGLNVNQTVFVSNAPNPFSLRLIDGKERDIETLSRLLMTEIETTEQQSPEEVWRYYKAHLYRREGFWRFIEREVSSAPTMNYSPSTEKRDGERSERPIFLAKIEDVRTDGELELRDQDGNLRTYHFKQVRYVI